MNQIQKCTIIKKQHEKLKIQLNWIKPQECTYYKIQRIMNFKTKHITF